MAIRVEHQPSAAVIDDAAYIGGLGDYARYAEGARQKRIALAQQQQQIDNAERARQQQLAFTVADRQAGRTFDAYQQRERLDAQAIGAEGRQDFAAEQAELSRQGSNDLQGQRFAGQRQLEEDRYLRAEAKADAYAEWIDAEEAAGRQDEFQAESLRAQANGGRLPQPTQDEPEIMPIGQAFEENAFQIGDSDSFFIRQPDGEFSIQKTQRPDAPREAGPTFAETTARNKARSSAVSDFMKPDVETGESMSLDKAIERVQKIEAAFGSATSSEAEATFDDHNSLVESAIEKLSNDESPALTPQESREFNLQWKLDPNTPREIQLAVMQVVALAQFMRPGEALDGDAEAKREWDRLTALIAEYTVQ